jgi:hypothetical protein
LLATGSNQAFRKLVRRLERQALRVQADISPRDVRLVFGFDS